MRSQYSDHVICFDQSEATILTWAPSYELWESKSRPVDCKPRMCQCQLSQLDLLTNQRPLLKTYDQSEANIKVTWPIRGRYDQSEASVLTSPLASILLSTSPPQTNIWPDTIAIPGKILYKQNFCQILSNFYPQNEMNIYLPISMLATLLHS